MKFYMNSALQHKMTKIYCHPFRRIMYVFLIVSVTGFAQADLNTSELIHSQQNGTEFRYGFDACMLELEQFLTLKGFDLNNIPNPMTFAQQKKVLAIVDDFIQQSPYCDFLRQSRSFPQETAIVDQEHLKKTLQEDHKVLSPSQSGSLEWSGDMAFSALSALVNQYAQYSLSIQLSGKLYRYISTSLQSFLEKQAVTEPVSESNHENGHILNCFLESRRKECPYSSYTSYVISLLSLSTLAYVGYSTLNIGDLLNISDLNTPLKLFAVGALAGTTTSLAWWGFDNMPYVISGALGVQSLFLLNLLRGQGNQESIVRLFNAGKMTHLIFASYYLLTAINYIERLYVGDFLTNLYKNYFTLSVSTALITALSLCTYIYNIDVKESYMLIIGNGTPGYIMSAFAALYGTQNDTPFRHHHIAFAYGMNVITSLITAGYLNQILPLISSYLLITIRYTYNLLGFVPALEEFDAAKYFIYTILIPAFNIFRLEDYL